MKKAEKIELPAALRAAAAAAVKSAVGGKLITAVSEERERSPRPFPCLRLAQSGLFHRGEHFPMDLITESK